MRVYHRGHWPSESTDAGIEPQTLSRELSYCCRCKVSLPVETDSRQNGQIEEETATVRLTGPYYMSAKRLES